jgi:multimeric flavodoxin WrbA
MNRLIIAGSPRIDGRSAHLANLLFEACIEECPEDELAYVPVSEVNVSGCMGCGACFALARGERLPGEEEDEEGEGREEGEECEKKDAPAPQKSKQEIQFEHPRRCVIDDDMSDIYELIDEAEELTIVSPVYFAGPPSQLKALLDRLQPYFAASAAQRCAAKEEGRPFKTAVKPAVLHVVGEGSDPHGFAALVTIVQSALAVAGYKLETVLDWVGKIDEEGEILEEADVIDLLVEDDEFVFADVEVVFGESEEADEERWSGIAKEGDDLEQDGLENDGINDNRRPRLRLNDDQVKERGRASSEAGRSGGSRGRTDKRSSKGGTQTNNRNPRKENQAKAKKRHASNNNATSAKKNAGKPRASNKKGGRRG